MSSTMPGETARLEDGAPAPPIVDQSIRPIVGAPVGASASPQPKRSRLRSAFAVSTSTMGGALMVMVLTALFGKDTPWFVDRLSASVAGFGTISLNVDSIFAPVPTNTDGWIVDSHAKIFVARPEDVAAWQIDSSNPGKLLQGLSLLDLPAMKIGAQMLGADDAAPSTKADEIMSLSLTLKGRQHKIEFTDDSQVGGLPVRFNPTDDADYLDFTARMGVKMIAATSPEMAAAVAAIPPAELLQQVKTETRKRLTDYIQANPIRPTVVDDALVVTTFTQKALARLNPILSMLPRDPNALLSAMQLVPLLNPELQSVNVRHVDISRANDAFLSDGVTTLRNVIVNGEKIPHCQIVRVVLYASRGEAVHVAMMRLLDGVPGSADAATKLNRQLQTFHVSTN